MLGRTHFVIGAIAGLALGPWLGDGSPWYFSALVAFSSLWPDVDHEKSTINRLVPVTRWVPRFFSHRGFFHSVFPAIAIYGVCWFLGAPLVGLALSIGYLSHLAADCLTREGCNLLYPLSTFRVMGPVFTGSLVETVIFLVLVLSLVGLLLFRLGVLPI